VVLAIGVVVALLGLAEFVAGQQHGRAMGQEQRAQQAALGAPALRFDALVVGRTLGAPVAAVVVVGTVAVVLAVGLVVLGLVADQVAQGVAVVGGDEVEAGPGPAAAMVEQLGRALQH